MSIAGGNGGRAAALAVAVAVVWWSGAVVAAPAKARGDEPPVPVGAAPTVAKQPAVVRVNATLQPYDPVRPWQKKPPFARRGLGVLVAGGKVLVTAETVEDATYVELEKSESGEKVPAVVEVVDYSANLALVKAGEAGFLAGVEPLPLVAAVVGDKVAVCQFESTGALLKTEAVVTTVEVGGYPAGDVPLLLGRVSCALQWRDGSFAVPVLKNARLAGFLMRFNARSQSGDMIPAEVVERFLAAAGRPDDYRGFPRLGISFAPLRDPQLRRWAGLDGEVVGGVYVTQVQGGGPAADAGMAVGDVLVELAGEEIDRDGNYADRRHGKLGLGHLVSTVHRHGETVTGTVWRAGQRVKLKIKLREKRAEEYVIPPYGHDRPPRYYVLGGLVFLELSRQYLREWDNWKDKAPRRLVYLDEYQTELLGGDGRERVVVLSSVLPCAATVGYEELGGEVVRKINGVAVGSLDAVAAAVAAPVGGLHKIEFEEEPRMIFLDAAQVEGLAAPLQQSYGIRELIHLK